MVVVVVSVYQEDASDQVKRKSKSNVTDLKYVGEKKQRKSRRLYLNFVL